MSVLKMHSPTGSREGESESGTPKASSLSSVQEAAPVPETKAKAITRSGAKLWRIASWKVKVNAALRKKTILYASHAAQLRGAAELVEPGMTALLQDLAHEFGGKLVGLENCFKSPESLVEKIGRDVCKVRPFILFLLTPRPQATLCLLHFVDSLPLDALRM